MSMSGIFTWAPAATALLKTASASSTYRWIVTGLPPSYAGDFATPHSLLRYKDELPILSMACMISWLPGIAMR